MLLATPTITRALRRQIDEIDALRADLGSQAGVAGPWLGALRRQWRASSAASSIGIEGFRLPEAEAWSLVSRGPSPDPDGDDRMALTCYAHAMDHVGVMAGDPAFRWVDRVILDLHFDACSFRRDKQPGRYRSSGIEVTRPGGGPPAYVGPPHEDVPRLMDALVAWLESRDLDAHVMVRAAMAHLHLVSVHPFGDGNGRISRIVQSLVLARDGVLAPEFLSIEEHLGHNTGAYYATLQKVQGGGYGAHGDATPWVHFCLGAHIDQARRRLVQLADAGARWTYLERLVERHGWPDRLVIALAQSLFHGVDRASYVAEADVSAPTASNDLRRLLDAGLVARIGRGRTTRYAASAALRENLARHRERRA